MHQGWLRNFASLGFVSLLAAAASAAEDQPPVDGPPSFLGADARPGQDSQPPEDDRLVAIGALSGAHLYTTYSYVGMVADAHRRGACKSQRVRELMNEVIGLAGTSSSHLKKVREGNLVAGDKRVIDEFLEVYELLEEEAQALIAYSRSESKGDFQRFQQARHTTWPKLKRILGIKEPTPEAEQ